MFLTLSHSQHVRLEFKNMLCAWMLSNDSILLQWTWWNGHKTKLQSNSTCESSWSNPVEHPFFPSWSYVLAGPAKIATITHTVWDPTQNLRSTSPLFNYLGHGNCETDAPSRYPGKHQRAFRKPICNQHSILYILRALSGIADVGASWDRSSRSRRYAAHRG